MIIKDIKNEAVRNEAIRLSGYPATQVPNENLIRLFSWDCSPQGYNFWSAIDDGLDLPLPNALELEIEIQQAITILKSRGYTITKTF